MKLQAPVKLSGLCALCVTSGSAFVVSPRQGAVHVARFAGDYEPMEGEGKINLKVRVESV